VFCCRQSGYGGNGVCNEGHLRSEGGGLKESSLSAYTLHFPSLEISGDFIEQGLVGKKNWVASDRWLIRHGWEVAKGGKYATRNDCIGLRVAISGNEPVGECKLMPW